MNEISLAADLPAGREKLLEAAVLLFGRDGFDGTSVRAVADEAGVSWGLVRFYFGSKEGLRAAAEEYVLGRYLQSVRDANAVRSYGELEQIIESRTEGLTKIARFLRRAVMEERPIALELIRELLAAAEGALATVKAEHPEEPALWDPIRIVVLRLGYLLLAPQFETLLKRDLFSIAELKQRNQQLGRLDQLTRRGVEAERREF